MEWLRKRKLGGFQTMNSRHDYEHDQDATHVQLTTAEYDELIRALRSEKDRREREAEAHSREMEMQQRVAAAKVAKIEGEKREAEAEAERLRGLNENLLRIMRERANAKRGLIPKKQHSGYRLSSRIIQTTIDRHEDMWRCILESPYPGTFPIDQVKKQICIDLVKNGILNDMGISFTVKPSGDLATGPYNSRKNVLYDYTFSVNPRSGLWEIQLVATKFIHATNELLVK